MELKFISRATAAPTRRWSSGMALWRRRSSCDSLRKIAMTWWFPWRVNEPTVAPCRHPQAHHASMGALGRTLFRPLVG